MTSPSGEHTVDATHGLLGYLNLDKVDRLLQSRLGKESSSVQYTTSSRNDLTTTTVNSIGVEGDIHNVEADGTHWLFGDGTFLGCPLETRNNGILDFIQ